MTTATQSSVVDAVTAVDSTFGTVFEQIDSWRAAIERHVSARHGAVTVAEIGRASCRERVSTIV